MLACKHTYIHTYIHAGQFKAPLTKIIIIVFGIKTMLIKSH